MAEKKKVEREFVEASTGKTGKRPAVVTAANKKSATGKRVAAVILWVLALAAEAMKHQGKATSGQLVQKLNHGVALAF